MPYLLAEMSVLAVEVALASFFRSTAREGSSKEERLLRSSSQRRTQASLVVVTRQLPEGERGCQIAETKGDCSRTWAVGPRWKVLSFRGAVSVEWRWEGWGRRAMWIVWEVRMAR